MLQAYVYHNLIFQTNVTIKLEGISENTQYYFRKRDFLKIRNWYQATKFNYVPEDTLQNKKTDKIKEWHFKFQFTSIELAQEYVHSNLKNIANAKQIVLLTSIFQRSSGCVLCYGKQIIRQAGFILATYTITLKEDVAVYFYIEDITPRDYQFCLQLQLITKEGTFLRLGTARYSLNQSKQVTKSKFLLFNHNHQQFDFEQANYKLKQTKKQGQKALCDVGVIQIQQELQEIKDISKYLPSLKIINQESKLPPAVNFNIKKKKEQLIIDPTFKITLQDLLIKINNPRELKRQILANNPFTMSHKQLVEFQIKEYLITLDMHNGWKFMNPTKNTLQMELVVQNQQQIYISSKQTEKLNLGYYENEGILFVIILSCKVNFKMKQANESRKGEFIIGWLPLPIDLSLKNNKIDMFFVNDHPFPATLLPHLSVQSNFTANFTHPLYQKYKFKQDDRKVLMNELPLGHSGNSELNKVIKTINSKKLGTQMISSTQMAEREENLDAQMQNMRNIIRSNEQQFQKNRFTTITGRADLGQQKVNEPCHLDIEQCVGRILKVRIQVKSLIPETQIPSLYFIPRKMNGNIYFLRQRYNFNCSIAQSQVKYHIPVSLNCTKSHFSFKINIDSVQQFQAIVNSRLVLTLYEQNASLIYCKGTINFIQVLGSHKIQNISYLKLSIWMQQGERNFGTILLNSVFQLQKIKQNYRKIEQFQLQKEIQKLPMQQRLKMRIGNFKGDNQIKNKAVSLLKQKKHLELVSNIVQRELLSDGQIIYELGFDSFHLLAFTNQDKSQNNVFTFHLSCPYAQLVNDQQKFRSITNQLNFQQQNYKFLQFIMKDKTLSYYQTTLQFNQSIGLLIKLNVNELKQGPILKKLEIIVKRNTLQTKRFVLKCTYKEPLIWQMFQCHDILQSNNNAETKISIIDQMASKYKDIIVLNQNIKFDFRTKEFILSKRGLSNYDLLCIVTPNYSKIKKMIILRVKLYQGRSMQILAGQKVKPHIQFQSKYPIQIIHTQSRQVKIISEVIFNLQASQARQELYIQLLRPVINMPIVITTHDMSGQKLWSYLIKLTANLSSNTNKIQLNDTQNISFSIQCENPYACKSKFTLFSSSKHLKIPETQIQIDKYEFKAIICKISQWNCMQSSIFVFMIDQRGNVIQTTQAMIAPKESIIYQKS